ncbi:hypothetical protein TBLA_0C03060 [Henningerozyma blattae CBS 6284]|uniref:Low temperature viability protein n=1 Tax=Henningerozyma blattae (strain ATCC 34711 / CBS 6284 / DSM 70876 / NBRC 10599 / NRRL Y-10934 / UCD 77-7) TaxID=1071380 RepID=I2H158_HENB6|nr:hypothetical protein TBLA_0C03060 [Tetrapisispora blattae CBS 6284]CCH60110.1 hypothetical protein TBLA_0C03060 [Tetrapisispora blattae CBS 6284]
MPKAFNKKNSQKYAVVHRPHDDPEYHNTDVSEHVLVSLDNPNERHGKNNANLKANLRNALPKKEITNSHVGEAAIYGIEFDDSNYDYTQHLKPIGLDPDNSIFIPSTDDDKKKRLPKKKIEDLFVEPNYREDNLSQPLPVFQRGMAKTEYLSQQQNVADELTGFQPDMNPALREVLEALEDEAYVVNEDVEVKHAPKKKSKASSKDGESELIIDDSEDDIFVELLNGGEADDDDFQEEYDEWDIDNLGNYEDDHYANEMAQFDNLEKLEDLQDIDYQADVRRFQKEQKHSKRNKELEDDNESINPPSDGAFSDEREAEAEDMLGDLPTFGSNAKTGAKKRKERRKKGALSDVSGFSMSSSAISRSETMTVLDDRYDSVIDGYDNYEEEQAIDEEESFQPFDMSTERADFESMLDDFLDNYELQSGGRVLAKKDPEIQKLKEAADSVSKGKLSMRRKKEAANKKNGVNGITNSLSSLRF